MIVWPAKDPAETLDFTWTVPLDGADTIASFTAAVSSGAVAINASSFAAGQIILWIAGGITGQNATISLTATTVGGRIFREIAVLPVFDRANELLALLRVRYGAFIAVDDGRVGYWLGQAGVQVDTAWAEADRDRAKLAYAAHMLSETGALSAAIPVGVTSFKSGTFAATVSDGIASLTGFSATSYGREFIALRRASFAGPVLAWTPPVAVDYW